MVERLCSLVRLIEQAANAALAHSMTAKTIIGGHELVVPYPWQARFPTQASREGSTLGQFEQPFEQCEGFRFVRGHSLVLPLQSK
jgi:hypothetical protein